MNKALKYVERQGNDVFAIVSTPPANFSKESFHELRVAIKKIRALSAITKFYFKDFHKDKYLKALKLLFKQAGIIRETQLEIDYLEKQRGNKSLPKLKSELASDLKNQQKKFFSLKTECGKIVSGRSERLNNYLKKLSKKDFKHYIRRKSKKIVDKAESKTLSNNQLHKLRREIKFITYLQKSIKLKGAHNPLLVNAEAISDELGNWHDMRIMLKQFGASLDSGIIAEPEKMKIMQLQKQLERKTKIEFNKIIKNINNL